MNNANNKNLFETNINFILHNTIRHIIFATIYPDKVAIEAPSIPNFGINVRFSTILRIAPPERISIFGQVFFTTRNWLQAT